MKTQATINTHVSAGIEKVREVGRSVYLACFRWFLGLVVLRLVPDFIVRWGIRYLLSLRLKEVRSVKRTVLTDTHVSGFANIVPHDVGCAATRESAVE